MRNKYIKKAPVTLAAQAVALRRQFPLGTTVLKRNAVSWLGELSPNDFSRKYTVELFYQIGTKPIVWVRTPKLKPLIGERTLPHVYNQETQELCLYVPGCGFWTPDQFLASTVILWACLWLHYFELWINTDIWHGEGIHIELTARERQDFCTES